MYLNRLIELVKESKEYIYQRLHEKGGVIKLSEPQEDEDEEGWKELILEEDLPSFYVYGKYDSFDRYAIWQLRLHEGKVYLDGIGASDGAWDRYTVDLETTVENQQVIELADHLYMMEHYKAQKQEEL